MIEFFTIHTRFCQQWQCCHQTILKQQKKFSPVELDVVITGSRLNYPIELALDVLVSGSLNWFLFVHHIYFFKLRLYT